jgi:signal transduction histidine kinase
VIKLEKLYLFDRQYKLLAQSSLGAPRDAGAAVICENLRKQASHRSGADRLKPVSQLCAVDGRAYFSLIVPVNTLNPEAFVQVVTDPTYSLQPVEAALGMASRITHPDDSLAYQSESWPQDYVTSEYIIAKAFATDPDGNHVLGIAIAQDIGPFRDSHARTHAIVIGISATAITLALIVIFLKIRHGLSPLKDLRNAAEQLKGGALTPVNKTSYPEIDIPISSFNSMATELVQLIVRLEDEITERQKIEDELHRNRKNLEQARDQAFAANHAKSVFLANMSHELRTPLNAIIGYSEMLREDARDHGLQKSIPDLENINNAGKHLLELVSDILDLSKIEAGKMELHIEEFSIGSLLDDVARTVEPLASRNNNAFDIQSTDDPGIMISDSSKLRQVLLNLLSNACKFTDNGKIELSVSRTTHSGSDWIRFMVNDTGIGISDEHLGKLFSEFTQADSSTTKKYGGTGLGLVLSQRFCELMGGYITVSSEEGRGSTFVVVIPVTNKCPGPQEEVTALGGL